MKWALRGENRALSDVTNQIWELNNVWSEAQNKFIGNNIFFGCKQKIVLTAFLLWQHLGYVKQLMILKTTIYRYLFDNAPYKW